MAKEKKKGFVLRALDTVEHNELLMVFSLMRIFFKQVL